MDLSLNYCLSTQEKVSCGNYPEILKTLRPKCDGGMKGELGDYWPCQRVNGRGLRGRR